MIAKYPGRCRYCGKPIEPGKDEYDIETKTSFHHDCHENQAPGPEAYRLAEELGFIAFDPELPADGLLLQMSAANRSLAAGRVAAETRGGPDATLFDQRVREFPK